MLAHGKKNGIYLTAYSPLGTPDRPWAKGSTEPVLMEDPALAAIAKNYNKSVPQVLLKFHLQRGLSVIPKSVTPARIKQNIDVLDFELSPADLHALENMKTSNRYCSLKDQADHQYFPF